MITDGLTGFRLNPRDPHGWAEKVVALLREREVLETVSTAARLRISRDLVGLFDGKALGSVYTDLTVPSRARRKQRSVSETEK